MSIRPSALGQLLRRAYPFFITSLVISPIAQFIVFPAKTALAVDNCTASLYGTSDSVTGSSAASSQSAVEVGVKFTPAFATTATAVRFYRSVSDSGGYDAYLWDSGGNLLGSGSDSTLTGTGWLSVSLAQPVSLTAGTTYIATYHAAHGQPQTLADVYDTDAGNTMISTPASAGVSRNDSTTTPSTNPTADTYVDSSHTSTNYGTTNPLWATSSGTRSFLRFNTNGSLPSGNVVTGATLKVWVTTNVASTGGFEVHPEDDSWTESGATWSNQPTWSSTVLATSSHPSAGAWVSISLPANAVNVTGNTSLGLRYTASGSNAQFSSREDSTHKPELTVNYAPQLTASADTYVDSNHTGTNYGTANPLWATSSGTRAFVRFNTNGAVPSGSTISSAKLKIFVTHNEATTGGFELHPEDDSWSESSTNWSNQPTWSSTVLSTSATPTAGSWQTIDVPTSAILSTGNTSLGLRYTVSGSNAQFASKEDSTHQPQLILNYASTGDATFTSSSTSYYVSPVLTYTDTTAPPAPTNVTPSVGPNSVTLNWDQTLDTQDSAVAPAASYTIYRDGTQIGTATSDVTTFNDNGLDTGSYAYTVKATDYCGNVSDASADPEATISDEMLFPGGSAPSATTASDPNPITVGVQFTSATPSEVNGVQFYRAQASGDGSTIGLWNSSGNLLESGTVADTDTTGWVSAQFQDPVKIAANTTYTVGYYTPAGDYSYTSEGLYSPLTHGNVTALASGGVTHSGTGMVLPASTSNASNYYVSPVIGPRQAGGVTAGDIIFNQQPSGGAPAEIAKVDSDGAITSLSTNSGGNYDFSPDVSKDGSKIVFAGDRDFSNDASHQLSVILMMNSDGSGQTQLTSYPNETPSIVNSDLTPRLSPLDGHTVVYVHSDPSSGSNIYTLDSSSSSPSGSPLTTDGYAFDPVWSPNGTKIAYDAINPGTGEYQLYIMNADGTNQQLVAGSDTGYTDNTPIWSPDGNRIYFFSSEGDGIWYYESSNGFDSGTPSRHQLSSYGPGGGGYGSNAFGVSADSSTLTYSNQDNTACNQIFTINSSGGTPTPQTNTGCNDQNYTPTFVQHSWASATEPLATGDAVSIDAPKSSDAFLHRGIHINLDSTGVDHWEYCWSSTGSGASPDSSCTSHLQSSADAGQTATLDYSSTYPDVDRYLWVRPHNSSTWNGGGSPLKVHTPKEPIWIAVGDSYSSGHNQLEDEWFCPDPSDSLLYSFVNVINTCPVSGAPHLNTEDYSFSWVNGAVIGFNDSVPSQWQIEKSIVALSGANTWEFGVVGKTPGTSDWATGNTQSGQMRNALVDRTDSWNVVSVDGGGIDGGLVDAMKQYYRSFAASLDSHEPWAVANRSRCPNSDIVFDKLLADGREIKANLNGIATTAHRASPGVRILNVGYPYILNSTNACFSHSTTKPFAGAQDDINQVNLYHKAITGSNIRYVDLTAPFGSSPVSSGYLQLTRLYGYPHPSGTGQALISAKAQAVLAGTDSGMEAW